jgi:hypothetical protein
VTPQSSKVISILGRSPAGDILTSPGSNWSGTVTKSCCAPWRRTIKPLEKNQTAQILNP